MEINENLTEVLNDLIRINNDRIEGYKRAAKEADDSDVDLKAIFNRMADESRQYVSELTREVVKLGGEPATGTTASGKIYRAWMDVKATFTGSDREAVLASCEFGEDAAQKAYQEALTSDETLSIDIRQLIANQKASLQISHDTIKRYRDMHDVADSRTRSDSDTARTSDNLRDSDNIMDSDTRTGSGNLSGSGTGSLSGSGSGTGSLSGTGLSGTSGLDTGSGLGDSRNTGTSGSLTADDDDDDDLSGSRDFGSGNTRNNL